MSSQHPEYALVRGEDPSQVPLILLHGSNGSEADLLPLAQRLTPQGTHIGVRGTVRLPPDGYAFFHRDSDRRIDEDDLRARLPGLEALVRVSRDDLGGVRPIVVGFSNGAVTAAALVMSYPGLFEGAVLLRSLSPFVHPPRANLDGLPVLILDGADDERRSPGDGVHCAQGLATMGADVTRHVLPATHSLTDRDERLAAAWLRRTSTTRPAAVSR